MPQDLKIQVNAILHGHNVFEEDPIEISFENRKFFFTTATGMTALSFSIIASLVIPKEGDG